MNDGFGSIIDIRIVRQPPFQLPDSLLLRELLILQLLGRTRGGIPIDIQPSVLACRGQSTRLHHSPALRLRNGLQTGQAGNQVCITAYGLRAAVEQRDVSWLARNARTIKRASDTTALTVSNSFALFSSEVAIVGHPCCATRLTSSLLRLPTKRLPDSLGDERCERMGNGQD